MEKETVDECHMDEPNDVSISSDDDDKVYVCSNKYGTHKPSRIDLNMGLVILQMLVIQWVKTLIDLIFLFTKRNLHYVGQQG